jgi:hypothetical protein
MTDQYVVKQVFSIVRDGRSIGIEVSSHVARFADDAAASAYLRNVPNRANDVVSALDDPSPLADVPTLGDESLWLVGRQRSVRCAEEVCGPSEPGSGMMVAVRVGREVAILSLAAPFVLPRAAVEMLATTQLECLRHGCPVGPIPVPDGLVAPMLAADFSATTRPAAVPTPARADCDPSYPTVCIPSPPPIVDCSVTAERNFPVLPPDPHGLDHDGDGVGCEPI